MSVFTSGKEFVYGTDTHSQTVTIVNRLGLHARAAAKFAKTASRFDAVVFVENDGIEVSGLSIMGLMMLTASPGTEIEILASGPQAGEALAALENLVANKFEEE